jgi:hypothetical protein
MKITIIQRAVPTAWNEQRLKDGCPRCNHEVCVTQVISPMLALRCDLWGYFNCQLICPICLHYLQLTLWPDRCEVKETGG